MNKLLLFLLLSTTIVAAPFGTYSNGAEGFYRESLILSKDGKGFYAMMAGLPVLWRYDGKENKLYLTGNFGVNRKVEARVFLYDAAKDWIVTQRKAQPGDEYLACVNKQVDERVQKALDAFDWDLKSLSGRSDPLGRHSRGEKGDRTRRCRQPRDLSRLARSLARVQAR